MMPQSRWPLITKRNAGSGVRTEGIVSQTFTRTAGEEPVFVRTRRNVTVWPRFTVRGVAIILSLSFVEAWWLAGTALAAWAEWVPAPPAIPEAKTSAPMLRPVRVTRCRTAAALRTVPRPYALVRKSASWIRRRERYACCLPGA